MLNFTVGPVMSNDDVLKIASESTPYFRTDEFSNIMFENEKMILEMVGAPKGSRCVFLTASGTGAMESCVMNILNNDDKVIVVNGGTFGQRFIELCKLHNKKFTELKCDFGKQIKKEQLDIYAGKKYTAFLVNMCETSSGVLYDMKLISEFCKNNDIILIVDAVSSFLADWVHMSKLKIDALITGSQKALAVQPGVSLIALAPSALQRVDNNKETCMYLSIKQALKDGERGQTPYTPAVTTLLQIHKRLKIICESGGISKEREIIASLADDLRNSIKCLPFEFVAECASNAVTSLHPVNVSAKDIVRILKEEYNIWVCPNGGDKADDIFRIGHIGHITKEDNQKLISALYDMNNRQLL